MFTLCVYKHSNHSDLFEVIYSIHTVLNLNIGSLPVANNELTLTVCQVGFLGCCEFNWQIRVRNCGTFNVFHLTSTPACPGRYCAGNV